MDTIQELITGRFNWFNFLFAALILVGGYAGLLALERLLKEVAIGRGWQAWLQRLLHYLLTLYEPIAVILLSVIFVFINPVVNGILLGLLVLAGFQHLRDYLSGRIVRLEHVIAPGKSLRSQGMQGMVSNLGVLGLQLKTSDGLHLIRYSRLLAEGYTLVSGEDSGGFYRLQVTPLPNKEDPKLGAVHLLDLLATAPYLDLNHQPEIRPDGENGKGMEASILLKEERHLYDLLPLMREWGYVAKPVEEI